MNDADDLTQVHISSISDTPSTDTFADPPGFQLLAEIGRGGMGVVYRARDLTLNRDVAVKILQTRFAADSKAAIRFVGEAQITGQLQHPGIPAVYQVARYPDGRPYLAMKLIRGQTLEEYLKTATSQGTLSIVEAIARALGYAHLHNVIHRDLKPSNIMIGDLGELQVMDWGLAKVLNSGIESEPTATDETLAPEEIRSTPHSDGSFTQAGSVMGTPSCMAPEQAAGEVDKVDCRSDVFGLGAIICIMLTGKPPFEGKDNESIRLNAMRGRTESAIARLENCGAEPEIVALCKRCLSFEPGDRPRDANAVYQIVAKMRGDSEERAKRAELERTQAEVRAVEEQKRRRGFQRFAAIVATVLILGIVGTGIGLYRSNESRKRAQAAEILADEKRAAALQAQQREAEERVKAVELARLSTDVKNFLKKDILLLADPEVQSEALGGKQFNVDLKLRDVILRAEKQIEGKFAGYPLMEAELRWTVGQALLGIDNPGRALVHFKRVYEIHSTLRGKENSYAYQSAEWLAQCHSKLGQHDRATQLLLEVIEIKSKQLGPNDPSTLKSKHNLSFCYHLGGNHKDAARIGKEIYDARARQFGSDHADTLISMSNQVTYYRLADQPKEAMELATECVRGLGRKSGQDSVDSILMMCDLAVLQIELKRDDDALATIDALMPLAQKSIRSGKKLNPEIPLVFLEDRQKLVLKKRPFEAIVTGFRETCDLWESLDRKDTISLIESARLRSRLAQLLSVSKSTDAKSMETGNADKAVEWLRKAIAAGFKDRKRLEMDPVLNILRKRDDFRTLIESIPN